MLANSQHPTEAFSEDNPEVLLTRHGVRLSMWRTRYYKGNPVEIIATIDRLFSTGAWTTKLLIWNNDTNDWAQANRPHQPWHTGTQIDHCHILFAGNSRHRWTVDEVDELIDDFKKLVAEVIYR